VVLHTTVQVMVMVWDTVTDKGVMVMVILVHTVLHLCILQMTTRLMVKDLLVQVLTVDTHTILLDHITEDTAMVMVTAITHADLHEDHLLIMHSNNNGVRSSAM